MIDWFKLLKTNDNPHGFELVDLLHQLKEEVEIASSHELQQSTTKEQPFTSGPQTITDEAAKKISNLARIAFLLEIAETIAREHLATENKIIGLDKRRN